MNREDIERLTNNLRQINAFGGNVNKFDEGGGVKRKKLTAAQEDMINNLENSDMLPTFNQFNDDLSNTTAQQYMLDIAYNPKRWFENSGEAEARRAWARSNNLGFDELAYGLLDKKDQKSKQVTSKMPTDWRTKDFANRVRQAMNKNSMFMTDVIESLPIVGDFAQATKAGNYFYNGEVGKGLYEAGMLGAGFLLPNVIEKAIKKSPLGKKFEKAAIDKIDNISINNLDDFFKKNPSMKEEYDIAFPKDAYDKFIKGTPLENASDEEINYALTRAGLDGYLVAKDNSKFATYRDWWLKNFKDKMDEEKKFLSMFGLTPRQENKFNSPTLGIKNYIESAKEAPNVGGYYVPSTNESFLNINAKYNDIATPESAHIHEGMSHPTDELIKKHRQNYKNVVEEILANHPNGDIIPESINWEEFRALLNEHRAKLLQESGNPNMSMEDFKKLVDEKYNSDKLINEIKKKDIELLNDPEYKLKVGNRDDFDRVRQEVLDDKLDVSLELMQKIFENSKFKRKALRDIANNEIIPLSKISGYGDDYGQALANLLRNDRDAYVKLSNKIKDLIKTHPALAVPLAVPMVLNNQGEPIDSVGVN